MMEDKTQDCEVTDIEPPVAVGCDDDLQFSTHLFGGMIPDLVDYLPGNIDGKKLFKCLTTEWVERMHEQRHFRMHSSKRKELLGRREVGWCNGNLYYPFNDCPFEASAEGKKNRAHIQNADGHKVCYSCGYFAMK